VNDVVHGTLLPLSKLLALSRLPLFRAGAGSAADAAALLGAAPRGVQAPLHNAATSQPHACRARIELNLRSP
jgi:hypothetical protein